MSVWILQGADSETGLDTGKRLLGEMAMKDGGEGAGVGGRSQMQNL